MKQLTVLIAKHDFQYRATGARGRPVVVKEGDRFWVTSTEVANLRTGYAMIDREGKGYISCGYAFTFDQIDYLFQTEK